MCDGFVLIRTVEEQLLELDAYSIVKRALAVAEEKETKDRENPARSRQAAPLDQA